MCTKNIFYIFFNALAVFKYLQAISIASRKIGNGNLMLRKSVSRFLSFEIFLPLSCYQSDKVYIIKFLQPGIEPTLYQTRACATALR